MTLKTSKPPASSALNVSAAENPGLCPYSQPVNSSFCMSPAPLVEFTKPLHDVEVREKESARFECEVSRENIKVRTPTLSVCPESPPVKFDAG